jgi:ABC-2 type transport system permease protein
MTGALRYLLIHTFLNSVRTRLSRLRQPKYLIGAILGGAYFYFYFYKILFQGGVLRTSGPSPIPPNIWPYLTAALLLVAMVVFSWILPASRAAIRFTEPEIAFLFPAPIRRRTLIIHKLLKSQLSFLFLAVIFTLLTGRFRLGSEAWFRTAGWWMILNTLNLHRIGASFALQRLRERGMADWKRRLAALLAIAALVVGFEMIRQGLPPPPAPVGDQMPDYSGYLNQLVNSGPIAYILTPFRWIVQPYFARDLLAFLSALGPALAILLLHFIWVIRADVAFEDAAISAAQKRAAVLASYKSGSSQSRSATARTPIWRLRPTGFAPIAFLWKAFLKFGGRRALLLWSTLFIALLAAVGFVHQHAAEKQTGATMTLVIVISIVCYLTFLLSLVMVGQQASVQLRQAMSAFDLIKTYPLPGWQIALGELIGAVVVGSILQWAVIAVAGLLASAFVARIPDGWTYLTVIAGALAVLLPAFNLATAILPSGAALMFPGWIKPQDATSQGLENTGIRLMIGIGQLLAMALALLPVAFFGVCAWYIMGNFHFDPIWRAVSAIGVGAFVLTLESALGVAWLGDLYDRYDLSQSS